jgi:tetratricopeptide (TPR) repeat protein
MWHSVSVPEEHHGPELGGKPGPLRREVDTRTEPTPADTRTFDTAEPAPDFEGTARFQIERVLGAGGMGVVYQVFDRERKSRVALKTLRAGDGYGVQRFKNEFRALANVTHRNLARLGELFHDGGRWFFTMELLAGQSFVEYARDGDRFRAHGFDEQRVRASLRQLASGLLALHAANLVHRDIKPSNILVTPSGRVVLLDFGLVAETHHTESSASVVGTAIYMAPEQARCDPVGPEADWYSVGVVLYEALTGALPFSGMLLELVQRKDTSDGPSPRERAPEVPVDLDRLCEELLRRDPSRRPTGAEIARRLGLAAAETRSDAQATSAFVGRQEELRFLQCAFDDARAEHRAVAVGVQGESGLGKSALCTAFIEQLSLSEPGVVVLAGRCYERESLPYKAFDGIVDALTRHLSSLDASRLSDLVPRDADALACVFPGLRRVTGMPAASAPVLDPQELRHRGFAALRALLSRMCSRHAVVLSIDDLQWADADSLTLLDALLRAPDPPPVLLLVTLRAGGDHAEALSKLPGDVRNVLLSPLRDEDASALALLLLPPSSERAAQARALTEEAAGHPLFLHELARYLSDPGNANGHRVRLDEVMWMRIERLPTRAREVLELLSVASAPVHECTTANAIGLDREELATSVRFLRTAHLLRSSGTLGADTFEPYHDRVREAVLARMPERTRKFYHLRLANALEAGGAGDSEELVRHLLAAGESRRAAAHAEKAAAHASTVLAFDRAVDLYRIAVKLEREAPSPSAARLRGLLRSLGDALVNAGRLGEAAKEYEAAALGADPVVAVELMRLACEQLLWSGRVEQGIDLARALLRQVGLKLPETPWASLLSLLGARAKVRLRGLGYRARPEKAIAPLDLVRIDTCWSVSVGLAVVDFIRGADFAARHLLLALEAGEPFRIARALCGEACYWAAEGGRAEERTAGLMRQAFVACDMVHTPEALGIASFSAGSVAMMEGRWRRARDHLVVADTIYREQCTGVTCEIDSVDVDLLISLAYLGEFKELGQRVRAYVREAEQRGDLYGATLMRTSEPNLAWLADDDPAGARREADTARKGYSTKAVIMESYLDPLAQARIDLYLGDTARAWERVCACWRSLKKQLLDKVQMFRIVVYNLRGTVALAESARRPELLSQAARDARNLRSEGVPWALGLGMLLEAGLSAAKGDEAGALARYGHAALQLDEADMAFHAACARWRQGELMGGDAGRSLVGRAQAFAAAQAIRDPMRFRGLIAPAVKTTR